MALQQSDLPSLVDLLNQIDIRVQVRRKTAAQWTSSNEVLLNGEWGLETDTGKIKIGDGAMAWLDRAYFGVGSLAGLTDVALAGLVGGNGIAYDSVSKTWKPVTLLPEAPKDGRTYGRRDGAWSEASGSSSSSEILVTGEDGPVGLTTDDNSDWLYT